MSARWSPEEIAWLKDHFVTASKPEIEARFPDRTFFGVRLYARRELGLTRTSGVAFGARRNPMRRTLTPIELAYLAGIFDGEGHFSLQKLNRAIPGRKPTVLYTPHVGVTNQSEVLIEWMSERLIWSRHNIAVDKTGWGWAYRPAILGHGVYEFLKVLHPYLVIKGERARLLMEFCELRAAGAANSPTGEREEAIWLELRALNGRRNSPETSLLV